MRQKLLLSVLVLVALCGSIGINASVIKPRVKASEVFIPLGTNGEKISLLELSRINIREVQAYTGRKMKFADKLVFRAAQNQLRKNINPDGTLNSKKFEKAMKKAGGETGFHIGGFALGFLLGLIGVLIAYLINDDYKSNRVKWAWIGLAVVVVLSLAFLL